MKIKDYQMIKEARVNRNRGLIIGLILIVAIAAIAWFMLRPTSTDTTANQNASDQPAATQPSETPAPPPTVTYSGNGFSPSSVTIKPNQKVTFTNKTSSTIQPSSDPHPQHTDNPELNVGTIAAGGSKSITPQKTGSFGMHEHFNPSNTLKITIQ